MFKCYKKILWGIIILIKFKAFLEVFHLALCLIITGTWEVIYNNRRVDYDMILKRLPRRKYSIDKNKFSSLMKRITKD